MQVLWTLEVLEPFLVEGESPQAVTLFLPRAGSVQPLSTSMPPSPILLRPELGRAHWPPPLVPLWAAGFIPLGLWMVRVGQQGLVLWVDGFLCPLSPRLPTCPERVGHTAELR